MLSDSKIKTLKPTEKMYRILDAERLYIEVRPSGKKIWRFKYTLNGKEGTISFGEYPSVSLADARKRKEDAKALLAKGINPVEDRNQKEEEKRAATNNSFKAVTEEFIKEKMKYKSEGYVDRFKGAMERDIYKIIGNKPIKEVNSADVLQIMKNTMERIKKQDNFATGEATANLNRRFIGLVMRYAIVTLRTDTDPTYAVKEAIESPQVEHARPLEPHERTTLRTNIDTYKGSSTVRNATLTLLYSMLRTIEVRKMEWPFVQFDDRIIKFPRSSRRRRQERSMKMDRVHIVPMSDQLYEILKDQYAITKGQKYVFASPQKRDCMISRTTLNKMLTYIGLNDVTAHDFRATASTLLYEKGYEEAWIEKQLAHAEQNRTKASYDHSQHLDARRKMMQDWADIVDSWKD
ncbi:tyrosine-type recombinase/integrase [Acinetobacter baumannii]|uniref:tyrosine-type recombinase/integrase n=1 Tax=Acinetobacter baumannii TaxID=470 RepID=UPI0029530D58|nr:integrase arm-type DNA-binding domain-containing protein [Acinetobacter baumannii]EKX0731877.1 integrase arm-type DNA-binding domain-containing protein [Acinetobacter baumannii]EKX0879554.1 integrase arm-type DNA-binding domain-containing protein [Acinetobacter baumannii]EKX9066640.1 integrase arm-type DNA-binding domain-containing protein [Acinetobacter baumannii]MDV7994261.1 integrase arm-type DNA-binding domain-containing protein [Acinetobacter baumannii]